ncbi:MAG TPA: ATP-binding protein [Candidatus Melainabacteria bacterium]|nr:ATP-binding protein [Candidatus Melainabacteria bacterium]
MKRVKDNSSRVLLILSASVVAAILMVAITATYIQSQELAAHRKAVIRTQQLITRLTRLESTMYKVESLQRGYLITGRKRYLGPYRESKEAVFKLYDDVLVYMVGKASQEGRLRRMREHMINKFAELDRTVELRRHGHYEEARNLVLTDHGQKEMLAFIEEMRGLKKEENRILRIQSRKLEETATGALHRLYILSGISLVAFFAGLHFINKISSARRQAQFTQLTLFEISSIMAAAEGLSDSLRGILADICDIYSWPVGVFWRADEGCEHLLLGEFYSIEPFPELKRLMSSLKIAPDQGLCGRVWKHGRPEWVQDISRDRQALIADQARADGLHASFAFPVRFGDTFIGVFEFLSRRIERPDNDVMEAFSVIGSAKGVLDSVLDNMGSGVIFVDIDRRVRIFNKAAERILGPGSRNRSPEEWYERIRSEDGKRQIPMEKLPMVAAMSGKSVSNKVFMIKGDEDDVLINVNARPVYDLEGGIIGGVVVVDDVTARIQAEQRVSEFYSMVSHELRTPLTSIKGSLGLLEGGKGGELSDRGKRLVTMGRQECDRLVRLINDILDIRKIEAGKLEIERKSVVPSVIVAEAIEALSAYAAEHKVRIEASDLASEPILADRDRIAQVLTNLLSNAVKFSPEGGVVQVSSSLMPDRVRIEVKDQGPGISEQDQKKLFKKFQQVNSTDSRPKGGTGLGLAICKSLVDQHEGEIGLTSAPGAGSTFWFEICREHCEDSNSTQAGKNEGNRPKVLLYVTNDASAESLIATIEKDALVERVASLDSLRNSLTTTDAVLALIDIDGESDGDQISVVDLLDVSGRVPLILLGKSAKATEEEFALPLVLDRIDAPCDPQRVRQSLRLALAGHSHGKKDGNGKVTVLLVEDDPSTREVIQEQIEGLGVECRLAPDGKQALAAVKETRPDLIVLDIGLPDMDGFAVVTELKREESHRSIPTVIYTARDLTAKDREALQLGLTSYLTKATTSEEEFLSSVRVLLNGLLKQEESANE